MRFPPILQAMLDERDEDGLYRYFPDHDETMAMSVWCDPRTGAFRVTFD